MLTRAARKVKARLRNVTLPRTSAPATTSPSPDTTIPEKSINDSAPPFSSTSDSTTGTEHEWQFTPDVPPHIPAPVARYSRTVSGIFRMTQNFKGEDIQSPSEQRPIAKLAHGLDRVLFSPGVHWLQDPRSRVYNFTPWLQNIPKLSAFDFNRVTGFVKSSMDQDLWTAAQQEKCQFAGSTSSLTGMLAQIYFLLSRERPVNLFRLSSSFRNSGRNFTPGQRLPVSVILNYKDGTYLTDSDPLDPGQLGTSILSYMGTMLEKFLTTPKSQFQQFLHEHPHVPDPDIRREAYRYAKFQGYVTRSQLDCHDERLPRGGVFDVKTRAAMPLRMDPLNFQEGSGYLLRSLHGKYESFESEYYDLIRSAFLKYSFQARIGNMDGVLVTYHNTSQVFGFEYVPLEDMDEALYGNRNAGADVFEACLRTLEAVTKEIITYFPKQSVSCLWKTPDGGDRMQVFIEPTEWQPCSTTDEKPIIQLDVTVENLINGRSEGPNLIDKVGGIQPWVIEYTIKTIDEPFDRIRQRKQELVDMQRRFWALPSGMTLEDMERFWNGGLGIGQVPTATFDRTRFTDKDAFIDFLRRRAREGARDTMRWKKAEGGKKKVVWKQSDGVLEEWEQDVIEEGFELAQESAGAPDYDSWPNRDSGGPSDTPLHPHLRLTSSQKGLPKVKPTKYKRGSPNAGKRDLLPHSPPIKLKKSKPDKNVQKVAHTSTFKGALKELRKQAPLRGLKKGKGTALTQLPILSILPVSKDDLSTRREYANRTNFLWRGRGQPQTSAALLWTGDGKHNHHSH